MSDKTCVLVFGATGLFGELLVRRLACEQNYTVVGVARNQSRLNALQTDTGISTAVVVSMKRYLLLRHYANGVLLPL